MSWLRPGQPGETHLHALKAAGELSELDVVFALCLADRSRHITQNTGADSAPATGHGQHTASSGPSHATAATTASGSSGPEAALALALALLSRASGERQVCLLLETLADQARELAPELAAGRSAAQWRELLETSPVCGTPEAPAPLVLDAADRLYLHRTLDLERRLARAVLPLCTPVPHRIATEDLQHALADLFPLPGRQRAAAALALENRLLLLTGGPGTGKTTTMVRILELFRRFWPLLAEPGMQDDQPGRPLRVVLAAPTGKAAARMQQALDKARITDLADSYGGAAGAVPGEGLGDTPGNRFGKARVEAPCPFPDSAPETAASTVTSSDSSPVSSMDSSMDSNSIARSASSTVPGTVPGAAPGPDTPRTSACPPMPAGDTLDLAPPQTLHRLLGLRPDTEQAARHAGRPLELDLLVVDEASMVDLALMVRLLEALPPHARLLLLGDRDQLASVEAGAVLADLCPDTDALPPALADRLERLCGPEPRLPRWPGTPDLPTRACRLHLDHSHRFSPDSPIGRATRALRDGDGTTLLAVLQQDPRGTLRLLDSPRPERIPELLRSFLPEPDSLPLDNAEALLTTWESRQILCALNQGSQGMETINRLAARHFCGHRWEDALHTGHPGMPLMILGNDSSRHLFNGDTGVFVAHGPTLEAVFRQGHTVRRLPAALLPRWQPAWAITVHKSQGSEYDEVLVLLPDSARRLLGRELLYTALSRARRQLTLCATPTAVLAAAAASLRRSGGLRDALRTKGVMED